MASVDVVVVGAGCAGLQAASSLREAGLSFVVLEARDRVGGRTHTEPWVVPGVGDIAVDIGGQWIGPGQKRVNVLVERFGMEKRTQYQRGTSVVEVAGQRVPYDGVVSTLSQFAEGELDRLWTLLDGMAREVPVAEPWAACGAADLDQVSFSQWVEKNCTDAATVWIVKWFASVCIAADTQDISLLYFLKWLRSGGGYASLANTEGGAQNHTLVGGMQQLAQRMAVALGNGAVRLSAPVSRIEQRRDGLVSVSYGSRGATVVCRRAVVAMSPPLCAKIAFSPPVSMERKLLEERMLFGRVIKVTAAFSRPIWRDAGLSGAFLSDVGPLSTVYDRSEPENNLWAIVGFIAGAAAQQWAKLPESTRRAQVVEQLGRVYQNEEAARQLCTAYKDVDWSVEEYSGGCFFSYFPPRLLEPFGRALRAPHGNVHYAGTETADEWIGYIEGALDSGERVARDVIRSLQSAKL